MNQIMKIVLIVFAVLVVTGGLLFAGAMLGSRLNQRVDGFGRDARMGPGARQDLPGRDRNAPGQGGMMGGGGNQPGRGAGPGPGNHREQANLTPVTVEEATTAAQAYLDTLGIDGLEIGDVTVLGAA